MRPPYRFERSDASWPANRMMAGNWKMNNTICRGRGVDAGRSPTTTRSKLGRTPSTCVVCPPSIDLKPVNDRARLRPSAQDQSRRPERVLGAEGRLHGRDIGPHAQGRSVAHAPSSATPSAASCFGETNEDVNRKVQCAARWRPVCHRMRRRIAVPCATRATPTSSCAPRCAPRSRAWMPTRRPPSAWWPTSPSGPSARAAPPRPSRPRTCAPPSARTLADIVRRRDGRRDARAVRRFHEPRQRRAASRASPNIDGGLVGGASLKAEPVRSTGESVPVMSASENVCGKLSASGMPDHHGRLGLGASRVRATPSRWHLRRCSTNCSTPARTPSSKPRERPWACPTGQMGNSEVGHLNIGAGRVVYQELYAYQHALAATGSICDNAVINDAHRGRSKAPGAALHLMGLLSDGGVHSSNEHLYALIKHAAGKRRRRCARALRSWTAATSRRLAARATCSSCRTSSSRTDSRTPCASASVSGRYYAMDRDKRWDRVAKAYEAVVCATPLAASADPVAAMQASYDAERHR